MSDAELCERLLPLISYLPMPPFEVETDPSDKRLEAALNALFAQLRQSGGEAEPLLSQDFARMAIDSRGVGRDAMSDGRKVRWQWIALGGGIALLALTCVGLAVAVPTGLAGAAAITATLAAFGPGGMVGGMATIAALTGTGMAAAAAGAAGVKPGHETVKQLTAALAEAEPEQLRSLLATTIGVVELKRTIGIDPKVDGLIHVLVDARTRISQDEQTRLLIEGRKSRFVADASKRIKHLNRAIDWLAELLPAAVTASPELPAIEAKE